MIIKKLITKNFKKLGGASFEFNEDVNILVGDNAQGRVRFLKQLN